MHTSYTQNSLLLASLLLLLLPVSQATLKYSTHEPINRRIPISDEVKISPFLTSIPRKGVLVFPSVANLPPILRALSLNLTSSRKLQATSPIIKDMGTGYIRRNNDVLFIRINFRKPRIQIRFKGLGAECGYFLYGSVVHMFRRPFGMRLERSKLSVAVAKDALSDRLAKMEGKDLVTVIDHARAAESVGLSLPDSVVVVFKALAIGSPFWRVNSAAGLELPIDIMIAESPLGIVYVGWNTGSLFRARFGLESRDEELGLFDDILADLASTAAGFGSEKAFKSVGLRFDRARSGGFLEGVVQASQKGNPLQAFSALTNALDAAPPVNIAYEFLHDKQTSDSGLPTDGKFVRVVIFGNPSLGTGIMQSSFTAALDLPVKIAVWTDGVKAGKFSVGYTAPEWIGRRHGADIPDMLSEALGNFRNVALKAGN